MKQEPTETTPTMITRSGRSRNLHPSGWRGCQNRRSDEEERGIDTLVMALDMTTTSTETARELLAQLTVTQPSSDTGYDPARFGPDLRAVPYKDCDLYNAILARDLHGRGLLSLSSDIERAENCVIKKTYYDSAIPTVERVITLEDAWVSGAHLWDKTKREKFAHDPNNLHAKNRLREEGCDKAKVEAYIRSTYGLTVTPERKAQLTIQLGTCKETP